MSERIIHTADLSNILGSLRGLQSDIVTVSGQVTAVGQDLSQTRAELSRLEQAFIDFVESDLKAKELALAETRQVKVRQELDTTFEYYGIVRRQATGILQASDIQLVRKETLRSATEELMISAPRYWLAPALVALSSWLGDNRALADRALAEAIRRDDEKTSLFFALIARRAGRNELNRVWLDRYFGLQNPFKLDRQTVVMVDALANGVFGSEATRHCGKRIAEWIDELSQQAGFVETQRQQWSRALLSKAPHADHASRYTHLHKFSPTWPDINQAIIGVSMHEAVLKHFEGIFQGELRPAASVLVAVDDLLSKLVTRFDDEELPLRRQEELCRLIIEEGGNRRVAEQRYQLQSAAQDEEVDFTQLLTNAAMHPEISHATRATQRYAVAHSRNWILDGHADVTASLRMQIPVDITVRIEGWEGVTSEGDNETELLRSLEDNIQQRETRELAAVKFKTSHWLVLALGVALILGSVSLGSWGLIGGAVCLGMTFLAYRNLESQRKVIRSNYAKLREQARNALRACLAEVVELRRDLAARDAVSERVTQLLDGISPEQHVLSSYDSVRRVMTA